MQSQYTTITTIQQELTVSIWSTKASILIWKTNVFIFVFSGFLSVISQSVIILYEVYQIFGFLANWNGIKYSGVK